MKPLFATQHEARLIASLPEGGAGMLCREVKIPEWCTEYYPNQYGHHHFSGTHPKGVCGSKLCGCSLGPAHEAPRPIKGAIFGIESSRVPYPLGAVLAVKEAWCHKYTDEGEPEYGDQDRNDPVFLYRATEKERIVAIGMDGFTRENADGSEGSPWISGARMPLAAVRSYIRITGLRVARVQDVTEEEARLMNLGDSLAEPDSQIMGQHPFALHIGKAWDQNRYQWLPTFEKVSREVASA